MSEQQERIKAWAGSVQRLLAVAPIEAVINEVGIEWAPHSTPPERRALREKALAVVAGWLERDLAAAAEPEPMGGWEPRS